MVKLAEGIQRQHRRRRRRVVCAHHADIVLTKQLTRVQVGRRAIRRQQGQVDLAALQLAVDLRVIQR
jgi:hypothetical protein